MAVSDIKMLWHNPCHNYDGEGEMNQKTASRKNWNYQRRGKKIVWNCL